jgi:hypothetical protein
MTAATMKDAFDTAEPIDIWPTPRSLPVGLLPVIDFPDRALPDGLRPWVLDIAERMQTPLEYVAVPAIIAASSVIGRKVGIRPQQQTDWQETPNLWGCIVGRPGVMKSPAVKAAFKPLSMLVAKASEKYDRARDEYDTGAMERDLRKDAAKAAMKKALSADARADLSHLRPSDDDEPVLQRYLTNDSSYQALGDLLRHNTNGLLVHRDELMSLLRALDREDNSEARGFFLTGWNGSDSYTFDRIGRGANLYVPSLTLSLMGSTQPGLLQTYVRNVMAGGSSDDGLLQRFGMIVWPDLPPTWTEHDREPNAHYRDAAYSTFDRLDQIDAVSVGAVTDPYDKISPYLRYAPEALAEFKGWREHLESRLRSDELHPALESHIGKYRKLVPALALVHHLASNQVGPVGVVSVLSALSWAEFLESHAQRIYAASLNGSVDGAKVILRHIRSGDLQSGFFARDIQRRNWASLGDDVGRVKDALDLLEDYGWLRSMTPEIGPRGGNPGTRFIVNPKALSQ